MRIMTIASLIAVGVFATASFAQDNRAAGNGERQWLSIPQVHAKLEAAGYRNIEKIERERGSYEAKAIDRNGARVKLYLHPQTGEIIDRRERSASRDKYDKNDKNDARGASSGQRNAADCNERRCRDDLPKPGVATPPAGK